MREVIAFAFASQKIGDMTYDEYRAAEPYSQPAHQGDHVTLPQDGGPTPTMWALAGFIEAVPRGINRDRTTQRLSDDRCALPMHARVFRNTR